VWGIGVYSFAIPLGVIVWNNCDKMVWVSEMFMANYRRDPLAFKEF
jgi:hypothetical protein